MTDLDRHRCSYVSEVTAAGRWLDYEKYYFYSVDAAIDDAFNTALNMVASAGGDAYVLEHVGDFSQGPLVMQVWDCGWGANPIINLPRSSTRPRELTVEERAECTFLATIAEASNWGFTKERNYKNARDDAIKLIQDMGGDAFYVVLEQMGSVVKVVLEAWHCNGDNGS
jgi:hypothetical protein